MRHVARVSRKAERKHGRSRHEESPCPAGHGTEPVAQGRVHAGCLIMSDKKETREQQQLAFHPYGGYWVVTPHARQPANNQTLQEAKRLHEEQQKQQQIQT